MRWRCSRRNGPLPPSRAASANPESRRELISARAEADVEGQIDHRRRQHDVGDVVAERRDNAHRQHEEREGHDGVDQAADDAVRPPAEIAGVGSQQQPHRERQQHRADGDAEVDARGHHDAAEDVAPHVVGAEGVRPGRRLQRVGRLRGVGIVGRDRRAEDGHRHQHQEADRRHQRQRVFGEGVAHGADHAVAPAAGGHGRYARCVKRIRHRPTPRNERAGRRPC